MSETLTPFCITCPCGTRYDAVPGRRLYPCPACPRVWDLWPEHPAPIKTFEQKQHFERTGQLPRSLIR